MSILNISMDRVILVQFNIFGHFNLKTYVSSKIFTMKESEVMQIQYMTSLAYIEKLDHIILNDVPKFMEKDDPKPSGPEALF